MKSILSVVLLFSVLIGCKNNTKKESHSVKEPVQTKKYENLDKMNWLIGNWTNITAEERSYEKWRRENDSILKAHSFTLDKGDTVFAEKVTLRQKGDNLYFIVVAYNQNDSQPVTFKMISASDGIFTFENPEHDFPTRISYSNPVKDSLHAWIEGTVDGESRKVDFLFKRND